MIGAPALDTGLLRSPAGTNPPGRENRDARQEKAQLASKTPPTPVMSVHVCQTDQGTLARHLAQ